MAKGKKNLMQRMVMLAVALLQWILTNALYAQNQPELFWGPLWQTGRPEELLQIFGSDTNHFYVLTSQIKKKSSLDITKIETDSLRIVGSTTMRIPLIDGDQPYFMQTLEMGNKLYMVSTTDPPSSAEVLIHANELGSDLGFSKEPVYLGSIPQSVIMKSRYVGLETSPDGNYLMVILPQEADSELNEKFELRLLDAQMNTVYEKKLEIPHKSAEVRYEQILVDGKESVYVLFSKEPDKPKEISKVQNPGRPYYLLKYNWADNTISEKALSIGVKWIYEAHMLINTAGDLQVLGYYSNMIDLIMSGTFSVAFDRESGALTTQGLSPFDRAFKAQFRPLGNIQDRAELGLYSSDYVFARPSSTAMLLSEKRDIQPSTMFNPATGTYFTVYNYLFDELLITTIDPSSRMLFNFKIPKFQTSQRGIADFSSYTAWEEGEYVYLVYNDHERNADLEIHNRSKYHILTGSTSAQATMYELGPDGNLFKYTLFKNSPERCILNPRFSYPLPEARILLTTSSNGWQFVKLRTPSHIVEGESE